MVIYEVNVSIKNEIFQEYYDWLFPHLQQMLSFKGFKQAEVGMVENQEDDHKNHLRICFSIESYADLEHYLTNHAADMRTETKDRFGDNFSVTRRVILEPMVVPKQMNQ